MRPSTFAASLAILLVAASPGLAAPPTDCPPGSVGKEEGSFAWCEPTVCRTDAECLGGDRVCRPIALCLQVGALDPDASLKAGPSEDAEKRLVVTGRCAPSEPRCPADATCSDMGRCVARAEAQRLGLLAPAAPNASASAASTSDTGKPPPRCGCDVPGVRAPSRAAALVALGVGLALLVRRRRRRGAPLPA
jgi:MYXO-CTERM domain-containing protein